MVPYFTILVIPSSTPKITNPVLVRNHLSGDIYEMQNRIREHRERLGWSQEKLATMVGTSTQQVSRLERSERGLSDEWLGRLSLAMGVGKADLLQNAFIRPRLPPSSGNFDKEDVEARLLRFWRRLSPEAKDIVLSMTESWTQHVLDRQMER